MSNTHDSWSCTDIRVKAITLTIALELLLPIPIPYISEQAFDALVSLTQISTYIHAFSSMIHLYTLATFMVVFIILQAFLSLRMCSKESFRSASRRLPAGWVIKPKSFPTDALLFNPTLSVAMTINYAVVNAARGPGKIYPVLEELKRIAAESFDVFLPVLGVVVGIGAAVYVFKAVVIGACRSEETDFIMEITSDWEDDIEVECERGVESSDIEKSAGLQPGKKFFVV